MDSFFELGYWGLFIASFLAATVLPFSSEAILSLMLISGYEPMKCLVIASVGNWLGGMTGYYLGYLAKWNWISKVFKIKEESLEKFKNKLDRFGSVLALLCWMPIIGDLLAVGLGMIRSNILLTAVLMFIGKFLRYWFLIYLTEYIQNYI